MSHNALQISNYLEVDLSCFNETHLHGMLQRRLMTLNIADEVAYWRFLAESPNERAQLKRTIYNHHSVFFRNPLTFAVLEQLVLKVLFQNYSGRSLNKRELRIWSAGCAAGQEAYSLAILLEEYQGLTDKPISYRILGTDVQYEQLAQATHGYYEKSALGQVSLNRINRWFKTEGKGYAINEALKNRVSFSYYDLNQDHTASPPDSIFGGFDLIFCANILFYYSKTATDKIIHKLKQNLNSGGYLITGEVERDTLALHQFNEVYPHSSIFQRSKEATKL